MYNVANVCSSLVLYSTIDKRSFMIETHTYRLCIAISGYEQFKPGYSYIIFIAMLVMALRKPRNYTFEPLYFIGHCEKQLNNVFTGSSYVRVAFALHM